MTSWRGWVKRQQRVPMEWRGGSVPNEVTSPARSLNPMRVRSLGRRRHSTALQFTAELEKRRGARSEVFSSPSWGVTPHFSWNGTAVRRRSGERGVSMQGRESGPGYLTSLGTEPPLYFKWTLRGRCSRPNEEIFEKWTPRFGGVKSGRRPGNNSSLHGRRSLASSPTRCDPILRKWGVSPTICWLLPSSG